MGRARHPPQVLTRRLWCRRLGANKSVERRGAPSSINPMRACVVLGSCPSHLRPSRARRRSWRWSSREERRTRARARTQGRTGTMSPKVPSGLPATWSVRRHAKGALRRVRAPRRQGACCRGRARLAERRRIDEADPRCGARCLEAARQHRCDEVALNASVDAQSLQLCDWELFCRPSIWAITAGW